MNETKDKEEKTIKGSDEWRKKVGEKNIGNLHAMKQGNFIQPMQICTIQCKRYIAGLCTHFEERKGQTCIIIEKQKEQLGNVLKEKESFVASRINKHKFILEESEKASEAHLGFIIKPEVKNEEGYIFSLFDTLEEIKKKQINTGLNVDESSEPEDKE